MCMGVLATCMPVNVHHVNVWSLQWPETGTGFPGTGVLPLWASAGRDKIWSCAVPMIFSLCSCNPLN